MLSKEAISDRVFVQEHLAQEHVPADYSKSETDMYKAKIKALLLEKNACLIAHYYTDPVIQELAEEVNGFISDSLEMARFGKEAEASTLIVAGVRFMGETAKIISPEKNIIMPTLEATCSLDIGCPVDEFSAFCDANPDHEVVVYANTSAAVKARADWVVTSSIALQVVEHLADQDKKIIWGPDKHLGSYVQQQTGIEMLIWDGSCIVHEEFKAKGLLDLKQVYPDAALLVHPESPASVVELADVVGSTSQLIQAAERLPNPQFIVATDRAIFYKMRQAAPGREFIEAPTAGSGATCRSCAHCPWMALNSLENIYQCLVTGQDEIILDEAIIKRAYSPLERMLSFKAN